MATAAEFLLVGRVGAAHGIKGWVKVTSFTDPLENILDYLPWTLRGADGEKTVKVTGSRMQGKSLVVQLDGETDRTRAEALFCGRDILVPATVLPTLDEDEFYWRDLIGLRVHHEDGRDLGKVSSLMETGSNDVLVVRGDADSIDTRERLIPWLPGDVVLNVDTAAGVISVDWDTEF
jgi:16S rRNA processing protein RimM